MEQKYNNTNKNCQEYSKITFDHITISQNSPHFNDNLKSFSIFWTIFLYCNWQSTLATSHHFLIWLCFPFSISTSWCSHLRFKCNNI